jgi:3-hydroxyacyl-[acyl-carrier-protein] dehydratase
MSSLKEEGKLISKESVVYFMSIEEGKFRNPVFPGCVLELKVQKDRSKGMIWKFKGEAFVKDKKMTEAIFTAKIVA